MADVEMIVVGGVRYRAEDAKRLGLVADAPGNAGEKQAPSPKNKARDARNKES